MSTEPLRSGARLGKYIIQEPLASGGFGRIFSATQTGPGGFERAVAIKVLRQSRQQQTGALKAFIREAQIIALLNHRNIVQVHEFAEAQGLYFLVMELVEGVPLSQLEPDNRRLLPWIAAGICAQVASALTYAHELRDPRRESMRGVIHRDIKPSNILVSEQGELKVTDFGLAKMLEADPLSVEVGIEGTPAYMSPEQLQGRRATPRSDIYSLGLVLFRLCLGTLPSRQATDGSVKRDALARAPGLPAELGTLLYEMLEPGEEDRPSASRVEQRLADIAEELTPSGARLTDELRCRVQSSDRSLHPRVQATATAGPPEQARGFAPQLDVTVAPESSLVESSVAATCLERPRHVKRRVDRRVLLAAFVLGVTGLIGILVLGLIEQRSPTAPGPAVGAPLDAGSGQDTRALWPRPGPTKVAPSRDMGGDQPGSEPADGATARDPKEPSHQARGTNHRRRQRPNAGARATRGTGLLSVNSRPWATVYVDNRRIGITPLFRSSVPAGPRVIKLVSAGGRQMIRRVVIKPAVELNLGLISVDQ